MAKRFLMAALLGALCLFLAASQASARSEEKRVIKVVTPDDEAAQVSVVVEAAGDTWLGVSVEDLDDDLREAFGLDKDATGVLVNEVHEDSPAEEAGLEDGDVIVTFDGSKVEEVSDLVDLVGSKEPGTEVEISVLRDGREVTLVAELSERPEEEEDFSWPHEGVLERLEGLAALGELHFPIADFGIRAHGGRGRLGVYVDDLRGGLADYFEVPDGRGVLVKDVVEDSPAEKAGIRPGDVILEVDGERIYDTDDLVDAVRHMKADVDTPVVLLRKGREVTVSVAVGPDLYEKFVQEYREAIKARTEELGKGPRKALVLKELAEDEIDELKDELEDLRDELKELKDELRKLRSD